MYAHGNASLLLLILAYSMTVYTYILVRNVACPKYRKDFAGSKALWEQKINKYHSDLFEVTGEVHQQCKNRQIHSHKMKLFTGSEYIHQNKNNVLYVQKSLFKQFSDQNTAFCFFCKGSPSNHQILIPTNFSGYSNTSLTYIKVLCIMAAVFI